jgi:hypothetical protein
MEQEVRVLIIGESPLLEGIVVGLEHDPLITMRQVRAEQHDTLHLITAFMPTAIIFQRGCPGIEEILAQISFLPGARLVGLDICSDRILVMDSSLLESSSLSNLRQLILATPARFAGHGVADQPTGRMVLPAIEVDVVGLER